MTEHRNDVRYLAGDPQPIGDPAGWVVEHRENFHSAQGTCPRCGGACEGSFFDLVPAGIAPGAPAGGPVDIDVRCRCGHDHGGPATGCGFVGLITG